MQSSAAERPEEEEPGPGPGPEPKLSASSSSSSSSSSTSKRKTRPVAYAYQYLRSKGVKRQHPKRLKQFFDFLVLQGRLQQVNIHDDDDVEQQARTFLAKVTEEQEHKNNKYWTEEMIMDFLEFHKERVDKQEISAGTLGNIFRAVECFCQNHDLPYINWKRVRMSLPKAVKESDDRCPTKEEIRKLVEFPDRRIKPIVYTMTSSGIRIGAWEYLRWKHIIPITNAEYLHWQKQQLELEKKDHSRIIITNDDETKTIAAQIIVYAGEPEEHFSFISPEAYTYLKQWMDFRASCGERVTEESWLMRDLWKTIDVKPSHQRMGPGGINGVAACPKKLSSGAISKVLQRGWKTQGIHDILPEGIKRHEFKTAHGFKKYFTTYCESAGVRDSFVQFFTDHKEGSRGSYRKPPMMLALSEYLKGVENLTINDNNSNNNSLQKQVVELAEKNEQQNYVIKGILTEKDKQIEAAAKEAQDMKKQLEEVKLQQQLMRAQYEIDRANDGNTMDFFRGLKDKLTIHVPSYRTEDPEEVKIKEILELGEYLRKKREKEEREAGLS